MKYEIKDQVSRYVKRFGMIMDPKTMNVARGQGRSMQWKR